MVGPPPVGDRRGNELGPDMDQCTAEFLAQRLLQHTAEVRRSRILLSNWPLHRAGWRLHHSGDLWPLLSADAADPLASMDDGRLFAGMACRQDLLSSSA